MPPAQRVRDSNKKGKGWGLGRRLVVEYCVIQQLPLGGEPFCTAVDGYQPPK